MGDKPKRTPKKETADVPSELEIEEPKREKDKSGRSGQCWKMKCSNCKGGGVMRVEGAGLKTYRCTHECHAGRPEQPLPDLIKVLR